MNRLLRAAKPLLPQSVRSLMRVPYREYVFRRAMAQFLDDPAAHAIEGSPILRDLIYAWGNPSWSALDEFLVACIKHTLASREGAILECGSGLSTLLVGAVAKMQGHRHWVLEHSPQWATKVKTYLRKYRLDSALLSPKPLKEYGEFCWYDVSARSMPNHISLVICDGPPASTKGGRYGLLPVMSKHLNPGCLILLDDAGRESELAAAKRWQTEFGTSFRIFGSTKPYIEMTVHRR